VVPEPQRQPLGRRRLLVLQPQERAQHRIVQLVLGQLQAQLVQQRRGEGAYAREGVVLRGRRAPRSVSRSAGYRSMGASRRAAGRARTSSCSADTPGA
jgi:hypothetical protein